MNAKMEVIKDIAPGSFWGGILSAIGIAICIKIFWAFLQFLKWLFVDYSQIRISLAELTKNFIELKEELKIEQEHNAKIAFHLREILEELRKNDKK